MPHGSRVIKALDILFWIAIAVFILVCAEATWGPFLHAEAPAPASDFQITDIPAHTGGNHWPAFRVIDVRFRVVCYSNGFDGGMACLPYDPNNMRAR